MINKIIGIDPGKKTGIAVIDKDGITVDTLDFWSVHDFVMSHDLKSIAVIIEKPRNKAIYHQNGQNHKAMGRTGVNVGSVIREAELLIARFLSKNILTVVVAPAGKLNAVLVQRLTGYTGRTNEHNRDALMMAYKHKVLLNAS